MNPYKNYFENTKGTGILATADENGSPNMAVYARPHAMEDGTLAVIMAHHKSYQNIKDNPLASYLFIEDAPGYQGKRLYLNKVREEEDSELLRSLKRRSYSEEREASMKPLHLVFFEIVEERPLVG